MKVYALFDNSEAEKINLEFVQPGSKGERVDISYSNTVPDNVRNSVDTGIKETYFFLCNKFRNIPERISICFRGLNKSVKSNSMDLAFAVSLITGFMELGYLKAQVLPEVVSATGVITSGHEIQGVIGIKEKISAALKLCSPDIEHFLFLPYDNFVELAETRKKDVVFDLEIKTNNIKLIPVKTISDVLRPFKISGTNKKFKITVGAGVLLCFTLIALVLYMSGNLIKGNTPEISLPDLPTSSIEDKNPSPNITTSENTNPSDKSNQVNNDTDDKQFVNVLTTYPENLQQNVKAKENIVKITFDSKSITEGASFLNIYIADKNNNREPFGIDIDKKNGTISLQMNFEYNSRYTVVIPKGAVEDENTKINKEYSFSFATENRPAIFMSAIYTIPMNGETNVDVNTRDIIIRFDTEEKVITAYNGCTLIKGDTHIPVTGVTFNKNSPIIRFDEALKRNTKYVITIPEGAFKDEKGTYNEAFEFSFTTGP